MSKGRGGCFGSCEPHLVDPAVSGSRERGSIGAAAQGLLSPASALLTFPAPWRCPREWGICFSQTQLTKLPSVWSWKEERRVSSAGGQREGCAGRPAPLSSAAKASFPKKEPFEAAVASQALGPCHVEKEDVSPTAWPRLPLTPPVSTHCGPYPAVYTQKSMAPKPAPGARGLTQSQ